MHHGLVHNVSLNARVPQPCQTNVKSCLTANWQQCSAFTSHTASLHRAAAAAPAPLHLLLLVLFRGTAGRPAAGYSAKLLLLQ